jgi:hypothetical protein
MALYVAGALIVGGTLESNRQQRKAREATERATEQSRQQFAAEQRKADIQNVRSVRQQIRQARLAQGSMVNVAAQTGGMGGSAVAGGVSSIESQLGSNLDYMSQIAKENTAIGTAALGYSTEMANASIAGSKAATASNIASLGSTIFGAVGGPQALQTWMKKNG